MLPNELSNAEMSKDPPVGIPPNNHMRQYLEINTNIAAG